MTSRVCYVSCGTTPRLHGSWYGRGVRALTNHSARQNVGVGPWGGVDGGISSRETLAAIASVDVAIQFDLTRDVDIICNAMRSCMLLILLPVNRT